MKKISSNKTIHLGGFRGILVVDIKEKKKKEKEEELFLL